MTTTPHKYAEAIKAWADGNGIQWRKPNHATFRQWSDFETANGIPDFDSPDHEWRVKPPLPPIKFRLLLWTPTSYSLPRPPTVLIATWDEQKTEPRDTWKGFIRWLGDWQEVTP